MSYNRPSRGTGPYFQGIKKASSTQKHKLGEIYTLEDGRKFVYCENGATELAAALLVQAEAANANANNEALPATPTTGAAIGATEVTITFGGAVTANAYKEGYLHINDATGEGHIYKIKEHAAGTSSVVVYLEEPIEVALVASTSEVTLTKHPCKDVIVCPTTLTSIIIGVPLIVVAADYYFWAQVKGPCPLLFHTGSGGAAAIGNNVVPASTNTPVAGAVEEEAATNLVPVVGQVLQVNATTEYGLVMLDIPGF